MVRCAGSRRNAGLNTSLRHANSKFIIPHQHDFKSNGNELLVGSPRLEPIGTLPREDNEDLPCSPPALKLLHCKDCEIALQLCREKSRKGEMEGGV